MSKYYVLYNPLAGNGNGEKEALKLKDIMSGDELEFRNILDIKDYGGFFAEVGNAPIIIAGGDGTLNKFVNLVDRINYENEIYYYPTGCCNDFIREVGMPENGKPALVTKYLKDLPILSVNGQLYRFLNGVGFGADSEGYAKGLKKREKSGKTPNFKALEKNAILTYKPQNIKVTIEGFSYEYKKVWYAPTVFGRYYGGGLSPAMMQDRMNPTHSMALTIVYGGGRLKTFNQLGKIFKGRHESDKVKKLIQSCDGRKLIVEFSKPVTLQYDGEIIPNVTKYAVRAFNI